METAAENLLTQTFVVPVAMITPNPDNPRIITASQMEKLVASLIEFPEMLYKRPLVCVAYKDGYMPLGGNMRLQAYPAALEKAAGDPALKKAYDVLRQGVPIVLADEWTPEMRRQFVAKDNISYGQWDWDLMANLYDKKELMDWGIEAAEFSFKERQPESAEDDFDFVVPTIPKTVAGDIYELNDHRLHCGDSTNRFHTTSLMAGKQASLCFTSPPYWVGKDYEYQDNETQINDFIEKIADSISLAVSIDQGRVCINTGTASINRIDRKRKVEILPLIDKWIAALRPHGWLLRHLRIWAKRGQLPATISPRTDVIDQHNEYIAAFEQEYSQLMTFWDPEGTQRGQERLGTPWAQQGLWDDIHGQKSTNGHEAAMPVELAARNILLYTKKGELVYEPFAGAGTTLIAAEQLMRTCYAQELSPNYCDVIVRRWVAFMRSHGFPFTVIRNGENITESEWLYEN